MFVSLCFQYFWLFWSFVPFQDYTYYIRNLLLQNFTFYCSIEIICESDWVRLRSHDTVSTASLDIHGTHKQNGMDFHSLHTTPFSLLSSVHTKTLRSTFAEASCVLMSSKTERCRRETVHFTSREFWFENVKVDRITSFLAVWIYTVSEVKMKTVSSAQGLKFSFSFWNHVAIFVH